jgi:hypothetical protein
MDHDDHDDDVSSSIHIHNLFLDSEERYLIQRIKVAERPHLIYHTEDYFQDYLQEDASSQEKEGEENDFNNRMLPLIDGYDLCGWRREGIMVHTENHNTSERFFLSPLWTIGSSSTLFRRDRQWPVYPKKKYIHPSYQQLLHRLQQTIPLAPLYSSLSSHAPVLVLNYTDCCQIMDPHPPHHDHRNQSHSRTCTHFAHRVEDRNIPAKIIGATHDWSSMPKKQPQQEPGRNNKIKSAYQDIQTTAFQKPNPDCSNHKEWTFIQLIQRFGNVYWRFSDTHGEMMTLNTYAKYITSPEGTVKECFFLCVLSIPHTSTPLIFLLYFKFRLIKSVYSYTNKKSKNKKKSIFFN